MPTSTIRGALSSFAITLVKKEGRIEENHATDPANRRSPNPVSHPRDTTARRIPLAPPSRPLPPCHRRTACPSSVATRRATIDVPAPRYLPWFGLIWVFVDRIRVLVLSSSALAMDGSDCDGDARTFKVNFTTDGLAKLRERVKEKLKEFMGDYTDDTLAVQLLLPSLVFFFRDL